MICLKQTCNGSFLISISIFSFHSDVFLSVISTGTGGQIHFYFSTPRGRETENGGSDGGRKTLIMRLLKEREREREREQERGAGRVREVG